MPRGEAHIIPGRCVSIELWCALAHQRISMFGANPPGRKSAGFCCPGRLNRAKMSRICLTLGTEYQTRDSIDLWGFWLRPRRGETRGSRAFGRVTAGKPRRRSWPRTVLFALAMVSSSLMVIGWIADSNISPSEALPGKSDRILSFEDRFILAPMAAGGSALRSLQRSAI